MAWYKHSFVGFLALTSNYVDASSLKKRDWYPTVQSYQILGDVSDPSLNRDSCGSSKVGDRLLWTCRDTQNRNGDSLSGPVYSTSAAWTNLNSDGTPQLGMYSTHSSTPYFPYASDECPQSPSGDCGDGTRFALWQNQPPLVTSVNGNVATAYTWIPRTHISGLTPVHGEEDPATNLYKIVYDTTNPDRNAMPVATLFREQFWWGNTIPFGSYGTLVKDGYAYLFGQPSNKHICLAKVPTSQVEDIGAYQYWVNGTWTKTLPLLSQSASCNIPNVSAGGQGTYYFSDYWNKYVWIGQGTWSVSSRFLVTTADSITGPWAEPVFFYQGQDGSYSLGAYTLQAHPGMSADNQGKLSKNEIYITYTKSDTDQQLYSTPLIHIKWN